MSDELNTLVVILGNRMHLTLTLALSSSFALCNTTGLISQYQYGNCRHSGYVLPKELNGGIRDIWPGQCCAMLCDTFQHGPGQ